MNFLYDKQKRQVSEGAWEETEKWLEVWKFVSRNVSVSCLNGFEKRNLEACTRKIQELRVWVWKRASTVGERLIQLELLIIAESFVSKLFPEGQSTLNIRLYFEIFIASIEFRYFP